MSALARVTSAMFPELFEALLRDFNPRISEARWKRAFAANRPSAEDYFGYALTDGAKIGGLLGMIFSQRMIRGNVVRFCNLHTWIVKPEYRAKSLLLLKPALDLKDHTLTDLTPSNTVVQIAKRVGFVDLDRTAVALPPLFWRPSSGRAAIAEMTGSPEQYGAALAAADLQIYRDHQDVDCGHLLLRVSEGYCYVVYSRIEARLRRHCYVHYISDTRLFSEHHATIRSHLLRTTNTRFIVVDRRMLAGVEVPFTFRIRGSRKLFRSQHVEACDVDSLYSEMVYLKHSTLISLVPRFLRMATR
jgi:hypothetical protein